MCDIETRFETIFTLPDPSIIKISQGTPCLSPMSTNVKSPANKDNTVTLLLFSIFFEKCNDFIFILFILPYSTCNYIINYVRLYLFGVQNSMAFLVSNILMNIKHFEMVWI